MTKERKKSELHCLEKSEWEEVLQQRGPGKGLPPVVSKSGTVFVGYNVQEVRVFKKIKKDDFEDSEKDETL